MTRMLLLTVMLLFFGAGCCSSLSPVPDWYSLYKECVRPAVFMQEGGVTYASFVFTDDCDKSRLAEEIKRGLETGSESPAWPYDDMVLSSSPITEQEFWALALSDLTGGEFTVRTFESGAERKARLQLFLRNVP